MKSVVRSSCGPFELCLESGGGVLGAPASVKLRVLSCDLESAAEAAEALRALSLMVRRAEKEAAALGVEF